MRHCQDMNQRAESFLPSVGRGGQCSPAGLWTAVWCWWMRSEFRRAMLVHGATDSFSLHASITDRDSRLTKATQPQQLSSAHRTFYQLGKPKHICMPSGMLHELWRLPLYLRRGSSVATVTATSCPSGTHDATSVPLACQYSWGCADTTVSAPAQQVRPCLVGPTGLAYDCGTLTAQQVTNTV